MWGLLEGEECGGVKSGRCVALYIHDVFCSIFRELVYMGAGVVVRYVSGSSYSQSAIWTFAREVLR